MTQAPTPGPLSGDFFDEAQLYALRDQFNEVNCTYDDGDNHISDVWAFSVAVAGLPNQTKGRIASGFYRVIERLGGMSDTLSIAGSYGDTLTDEQIADELEAWLSLAPTPKLLSGDHEFNPDLSMAGEGYCMVCGRHQDVHAPTAPVEASGSERNKLKAIVAYELEVAGYEVAADDDKLHGATADAILNHPQPSGETQEVSDAVVRLAAVAAGSKISDVYNATWCFDEATAFRTDLIKALAALRPAPVASEGQHSSGEVDRAWLIDIINEHSFASDAADMILERLATPVAETAGEAVAWIDATDIDHLLEGNPLTTNLFPYETRDATKALYTAPVPAQDDDKLRRAVEALEDISAGFVGPSVNQVGHLSRLKERADEALAALKSTAAKEGGKRDRL